MVTGALLATAVAVNNGTLIEQHVAQVNRVPTGNRGQTSAPVDVYPVTDGFILLAVTGNPLYRRWAKLMLADTATALPDDPDWLNDPNTALFAIILMSAWQAMGFHMVIWLSGLQTISADLYEAAALDGATGWQQFVHVTWPGLKQTRTFILITITIAAFSLFTQIQIMTQGGPLDSTSTLVFLAVRTGFQQQQTGYASAMSLVFFVLVLAVSLVQRYLTRDKELQR